MNKSDLGRNLHVNLLGSLWFNLWPRLRTNMKFSMQGGLWYTQVTSPSLWDNLRDSLWESLRSSLRRIRNE